jgi:pyridoxamine 5'-phosphate oxidase
MQPPTHLQPLVETGLAQNPFTQFRLWFDHAESAAVPDANAMTLATATPDGKPSARIVLLKGFDERGFCFFTNYDSKKGTQLDTNPHAALVFFWQPLHRQVRIEGAVERMTDVESETYFHSRPRESQIGALASPQSNPIPNREFLEERFRQLSEQYNSGVVPRPTHWGGYRVIPHTVEFWQGRENRLHDRLVYYKEENQWRIERLAP